MALRGGPTEQCRSEGTPSLGEVPSGGAQTFGYFGAFAKVTRRKGGITSGRYRSNGYTHDTSTQPNPTAGRHKK
ncbi:transposase [Pseudomonas mediterranea]